MPDGTADGVRGGLAVARADRAPEPATGAPYRREMGRWSRSRAPLLALAAIVAVAFVMRVYDLRGNPPGVFCDEASISYNAYLVLHTGADEWGIRFPIYFRSFGDYKNPVFIYAAMPLVALMGLDPLAVRLTAVLLGTATVALMYPLALELFRRRDIALLAAASLAIMPWHVLWSRVAFEVISMPFCYVLAMLTFLVALRRCSSRLYLASFALWGISTYTYSVARLLTPLLLIGLLLIYHRDVRAWGRYTAAGLGIVAVLTLPLVQALLSGAATARFNQIGVISQGLHGWALITTIARLYAQHFSVPILFIYGAWPGEPVLRAFIPGLGVLYWAQLPLLAAGLVALLARLDRPALLVFAWFLLYPIGGTFTDGFSQVRDLFGVVPFSLAAGYGAAQFWRWLQLAAPRGHARRPVMAGAEAVAAAALVVSLLQLWNQFYVRYPRTTAGYWGWQEGPAAILAYFKRVEPRYDDLFMTGSFNSPEIFIPFYAPTGCQRCAIGGLDRYNPARRQLFALRPEEMLPGFQYLVRRTLYYGDGTVAFRIVEVRR